MQSSEADRYRSMMIEVKGRTRLIKGWAGTPPGIMPLPALVELCYLNLRKILEVIAMGSLLANVKSFGTTHDRLIKYWNPKDLLRDISKLNPNFYPQPVLQTPSKMPGVKMDLNPRKDEFLTKDRFITLYDICGGVLHSRNPFRPEPDYAALLQDVPKWVTWMVNLLNAHTIQLEDDSNLYLFQMGAEGENPSFTPFALKSSSEPGS